MKKIRVFGNSQTCPNCVRAKQYLDAIVGHENYEYFDLATTDAVKRIEYKKTLHKLGVNMIPAIYIDDNPAVIGFGVEQIDEIQKYLSK